MTFSTVEHIFWASQTFIIAVHTCSIRLVLAGEAHCSAALVAQQERAHTRETNSLLETFIAGRSAWFARGPITVQSSWALRHASTVIQQQYGSTLCAVGWWLTALAVWAAFETLAISNVLVLLTFIHAGPSVTQQQILLTTYTLSQT
jgi:hypothetical protein